MTKRFLTILLAVALTAGIVFAQTPAKPYSDLVARDVLTAKWLMGTFNVLYSWAQATNASVTLLMSGITYGTPVMGSATTSISSQTSAITWFGTGLDYISMNGSGVMRLEGSIVVTTATTGADVAAFGVDGSVVSNATHSSMIGSLVTLKHRTSGATEWSVTASSTAPGVVKFFVDSGASTSADVLWDARVITHEKNY